MKPIKPIYRTALAIAIVSTGFVLTAGDASAAPDRSLWEWIIDIFASEGGLGTTRYR